MLKPEKKLNKAQLRWLRVTDSLTFREMNILMERFVLGKTLLDIAEKYNVTNERIRQLETSALKKVSLHSN